MDLEEGFREDGVVNCGGQVVESGEGGDTVAQPKTILSLASMELAHGKEPKADSMDSEQGSSVRDMIEDIIGGHSAEAVSSQAPGKMVVLDVSETMDEINQLSMALEKIEGQHIPASSQQAAAVRDTHYGADSGATSSIQSSSSAFSPQKSAPPVGPLHGMNGMHASLSAKDREKTMAQLCAENAHAAAMYGDIESLKKLITDQNKDKRDNVGFTALHFAACYGQHQAVDWLVGKGSDVNARNKHKWTPLHVASRNGNLECVAALLAANADMHAEDVQKWTPLHNASCSSSLATVDKLIEAGANPTNRDVDGWTPLHFAARFNNVEAIESLLLAGADANIKDVDGWTALHNSARNGMNRCVSKLLEKGASLLAKSRYEETPLHVACRKGKAKVVQEMVSFAQSATGEHRDLYRTLLNSRDTEGRTPVDVSSSAHIRDILRGDGAGNSFDGGGSTGRSLLNTSPSLRMIQGGTGATTETKHKKASKTCTLL